jgi:kinetochore protein NDC80
LGTLTMSQTNARASLCGGPTPQQDRRKSTLSNAARLPDPRNITEKTVVNQSIRKLCEFLTTHGYKETMSPKILATPSTKDFCNIVAFLLKQLDSNFKITGKTDEEFITVFKYLGYPFQIQKSNITAVGSPHAWPNLLACLTWLLELLNYDQLVRESDQREELDMDPSASEKGFYSYLGRAYHLFLTAQDPQYIALEEQFIKAFEDKDILVIDQIEALDKRNGAIAAEIEHVKNRSAYLPELVAKKKQLQVEHNNLGAAVDELAQTRKMIHDKVEMRRLELSSLNNGIAALEEKIATMRQTIQHQDLSPEDVLNLVNERKRLEDASAAAAEQRHIAQRQIKELEATLRARLGTLEQAVKSYHAQAESLKLVPATARNARGLDLSIVVDTHSNKRSGVLKTEVRNHILPALQQMKAELMETTYDLRAERMREDDTVGEMEGQKSEYLEVIASSEVKQRRAEVTYQREKELNDQALAVREGEVDTMEARLIKLRDTAAAEATLTAAQRRIAEINAIRAARKAEHERKVGAMKNSILEVVNMCADHREMVQQQLDELKGMYADRLQSMLQSPMYGENGYNGDSILSEGLEY